MGKRRAEAIARRAWVRFQNGRVMTIVIHLRNVRLGLRAESPEAKGLLSRTVLFSTYVPCEIDRGVRNNRQKNRANY